MINDREIAIAMMTGWGRVLHHHRYYHHRYYYYYYYYYYYRKSWKK